MKTFLLFTATIFILTSCINSTTESENKNPDLALANEVKSEFIRSWEGYKTYAWGHDVLLPLSKGYKDWYEESLHISPIDAYSTMKVMGLDEYAETMKYLYLTFSHHTGEFVLDDYIFNTEAHPFLKSNFNHEKVKEYLGLQAM